MTSGGLAVVGTRDPGSVLTGQTAEKELGERGGQELGRQSLETAGGRGAGRGAGKTGWPGRQAAEARGPRARVRVGQNGGLSVGSGARRRPRRGWMATGVPGAASGLSSRPPWSLSAASGAAARHAPLLPALRLSSLTSEVECDEPLVNGGVKCLREVLGREARVSQQRSGSGGSQKTTLRLGEGRRGARTAGLEGNPGPRRDGRGPSPAGCTEEGRSPGCKHLPGTTLRPGLSGPGVLQGRPGQHSTVLLGSGAGREEMSRVSF